MGTIVFPDPLGFNTATPRVNETAVEVTVLSDDKTAVIHNTAAATTDGSGNISNVVDAAIVSGTFYRVLVETTDGGTTPMARIQATA